MQRLVLSLFAVLSLAGSAPAATLYTSRAAWEAAAPGFVTDDFESYPVQRISSGSIVYADFDFVVPFNHENVGNCWLHPTVEGSCFTLSPPDPANMILAGDVHEDEDGSYNDLVFHDPIYAFGIDILWKEDAEDGPPLVFDVAGLTVEVNGENGYPRFVGVVSDTPFTLVHIRGDRLAYQVDNVSYQSLLAVPEPATGALLAAGLIALGRRTRRAPR